MDHYYDNGANGCQPCLSCPTYSYPSVNCVTNIVTQCFCQSGYQGPNPFQCAPDPVQSCLECSFNLVPIVACVSNPATQCACPAGQVQRNGQWCYPVPSPVSAPVGVGNPWNPNPRSVPPPVPRPVAPPVPRPLSMPVVAPAPVRTYPAPVPRPGEVECQGKSGKGKGGKGSSEGGEHSENCGKSKGKSGKGKDGKGKSGKGKGGSYSERDSLAGASGAGSNVSVVSAVLMLLPLVMLHW